MVRDGVERGGEDREPRMGWYYKGLGVVSAGIWVQEVSGFFMVNLTMRSRPSLIGQALPPYYSALASGSSH